MIQILKSSAKYFQTAVINTYGGFILIFGKTNTIM